MTISKVRQDGQASGKGQDVDPLEKNCETQQKEEISSDILPAMNDVNSDAEELQEELKDSQLTSDLLFEGLADGGDMSSTHVVPQSTDTNQDADIIMEDCEARDEHAYASLSLSSPRSAKPKNDVAPCVNARDHRRSPLFCSTELQGKCTTSDGSRSRSESIKSYDEAIHASERPSDRASLGKQTQSDFHNDPPSSPVSPASVRHDKQSRSNATSRRTYRNGLSAKNALRAEYEQDQQRLQHSLDFEEWLTEKLGTISKFRCHGDLEYEFVGFSKTSHRRRYKLASRQNAVFSEGRNAPRSRSAEKCMKEIKEDSEVEMEGGKGEQLVSESRDRELAQWKDENGCHPQ